MCYDFNMGKNASKNFVNQFKNTRRLAGRQAAVPHVGQAGLRVAAPLWGQAGRHPLVGQAGRLPLVGQAHLGKLVKGQAGGRPLVGPARHLKKLLPGERKNEKNPNRGDK